MPLLQRRFRQGTDGLHSTSSWRFKKLMHDLIAMQHWLIQMNHSMYELSQWEWRHLSLAEFIPRMIPDLCQQKGPHTTPDLPLSLHPPPRTCDTVGLYRSHGSTMEGNRGLHRCCHWYSWRHHNRRVSHRGIGSRKTFFSPEEERWMYNLCDDLL